METAVGGQRHVDMTIVLAMIALPILAAVVLTFTSWAETEVLGEDRSDERPHPRRTGVGS